MSNLIWRDGRDNSDYMQNSPSLKILLENSIEISKSSNIFENGLNKIKMKRLEYFNTLIVGSLSNNYKFETN